MAGDFFDQASIYVKAGAGGNGSASFRREKFVPLGGPDGGDGGRGGCVYLVADPQLNTLLAFRYKTRFLAENGGHGGKNAQTGARGKDIEIAVPVGTIVRTEIEDESYTLDLEQAGQRLLAVRGGKGGLGNIHFTTPTRQAPRLAELGEPGEELQLELELKLLADVGLVGFPNAGKSTLLSVISAAQPKIAAYPFTTLQPNLGIVSIGYDRFVVADIPGIIEGAHEGIGLGIDFLRHVERTRLLLHIIDAAGVDGRDPLTDYHQINAELREYHPKLAEKPQIVVLNKLDLPEARERLADLKANLPVPATDVFAIAAATHEGLEPLLKQLSARLRSMPQPHLEPIEHDEPPLTWPVPEVDPALFTIAQERDGWRVSGKKIERLVTVTNFAQAEALDRLQRVLAATGISDALLKAGVQESDIVRIAKAELVWSEIETYG